MRESTSGPATGTAGRGETAPEGDYRIREAEARLDRRLSVVESRLKRARTTATLAGVGFLLTLAALVAVVTTVGPDDGSWAVDSLSTREVVLRDAEGIARGVLATDDDGRARLALSDRDGRERIRLTVLADGSPGVTISDSDDRPRVVLGYLPDGTTSLVLADDRGVSRAVFGLEPDGSTQALFADRSGAIRTLVGVGADGEPEVSVYDGERQESPPAP